MELSLVTKSPSVFRVKNFLNLTIKLLHFQYQSNDDEGELEGALVEYCRIDSHNYKPEHSVCEAASVVSARGNNNNDKVCFCLFFLSLSLIRHLLPFLRRR